MLALISLTNFVAVIVVTMDATVTTKAASSPSGRSALTDQLHAILSRVYDEIENMS